jgi:MFS family permease
MLPAVPSRGGDVTCSKTHAGAWLPRRRDRLADFPNASGSVGADRGRQAAVPIIGASMTAAISIRDTFAYPAFRGLWAGSMLYFIANGMQVMAASWLVVERTGSGFLAALVQTAVFLPMFLLALPGGVLADVADRRRLLLIALTVQAVALALLVLLQAFDVAGPVMLLLLTFVVGSCTAMLTPAWNSTVADTVPRDSLPMAITLMGIAYNSARAVGPTLAGVVFALAGAGWVFAAAAAGTLAMMQTIRRWPPPPHPPSRLPPERLWGGMASGLRFAWHSRIILAQLVRTMAYGGAAAALWGLLPAIGQQQLGLGAAAFGLLMGCLGAGAVAAGLFVNRWRARYGLEAVIGVGCAVYAAAMATAALATWAPLVYLALAASGASWASVMSTFNTATQTSAPLWVRARAVAMHAICALGAFAIGSALWGAVSGALGLQAALLAASVLMAGGPLLARWFPLRMGEAREVTQAPPWQDLIIAHEPAPSAGPIAVEVGYRIRPEDSAAFLAAITALREPRRRDGATLWRVYRDLGDPERFVERFIVSSWADYLHQRARATLADQELETRVRAFLRPGEKPTVQHYIAER